MSRTPLPPLPIFLSLMPIYSITMYITLEKFVCKMYGSSQQLVILCRFEICQKSFKPLDNVNPLCKLRDVKHHSTLPVRLLFYKKMKRTNYCVRISRNLWNVVGK